MLRQIVLAEPLLYSVHISNNIISKDDLQVFDKHIASRLKYSKNVFDSTFYGLGKTNYMLFESVVTNTVYYGAAFILYLGGIWTPTLTGIALLFGLGNAFDSLVSFGAYVFLLRKQQLGITPVE